MSAATESVWTLRMDIATAKLVIRFVAVCRDFELTDDGHVYFFDRYSRRAAYHRRHGHEKRAQQLQEKVDAHFELGGGDDSLLAAVVGVPRPTRGPRLVDAVGAPRPKNWLHRRSRAPVP